MITHCIQRGAEDQGKAIYPKNISGPFWAFGRRSRYGGKKDPGLKRRVLFLRTIKRERITQRGSAVTILTLCQRSFPCGDTHGRWSGSGL